MASGAAAGALPPAELTSVDRSSDADATQREEIGPEMVGKRLVGQCFLVVQTNWARNPRKLGCAVVFIVFFLVGTIFRCQGSRRCLFVRASE